MAADRDILAQEAVHLLLGDQLVECSRSFVNLNSQVNALHALRNAIDLGDKDTTFEESFFFLISNMSRSSRSFEHY